jgi:hypothetical protein
MRSTGSRVADNQEWNALVRLGGTADQITLEGVQAAALGRVDFSIAQELLAGAGL